MMYPTRDEGVIPTGAKRSGGILCFSAAKQHKRFLDSRREASLPRNDVHLLKYTSPGSALGSLPNLQNTTRDIKYAVAVETDTPINPGIMKL